MMSATTARYERALRDLAENLGQSEELADLLDYFAGLLRGYPADPEGPPLEMYPSLWQVRRTLQRRSCTVNAAWDEWRALPADVQDGQPSPQEALEARENDWS
jgi:hypothetical protein